MNGQELFEKLSQMSEDQRKTCQFWQLTDWDYFRQCVDIVKDVVTMEADASEDDVEYVVRHLSADKIADIARTAQTIEGEVEDTYWDGFDDTYRQVLKERLVKEVEDLKQVLEKQKQ